MCRQVLKDWGTSECQMSLLQPMGTRKHHPTKHRGNKRERETWINPSCLRAHWISGKFGSTCGLCGTQAWPSRWGTGLKASLPASGLHFLAFFVVGFFLFLMNQIKILTLHPDCPDLGKTGSDSDLTVQILSGLNLQAISYPLQFSTGSPGLFFFQWKVFRD